MNEFEKRMNNHAFELMNDALEELAEIQTTTSTLAASVDPAKLDEDDAEYLEEKVKHMVHLIQDTVYSLWKASSYAKNYVKTGESFCDELYGRDA